MGLLDAVTFFCKCGKLILHTGRDFPDKQIMSISLSNVGVWFSKINFPSSKNSRFFMESTETKHNSVSQIVEVTIAVSNTF